jgi:hypothetical protein
VSTITRTWLAFAAIGAGLIHLALVIGSPLPIALVAGTIGVVEFGWGVVTFSRERIDAPRLVLFCALAPMLLWGLLIAAATVFATPAFASGLGLLPLTSATLLELVVAVTIAIGLRRGTDFRTAAKAPPAGRYLGALLVGGILVGALTTPALASTAAGRHAHSHGGTTLVLDPHSGH